MRTDRLPPLALAHLTLLDQPPLALAPIAARAGFAAIGLRLHPAHPGGIFYDLSTQAARAALRRCLDGEGIRLHDVEFVTIGADFDADAFVPLLVEAAELGAARVSACGDDPEPARQAASFARLCERAAPFGLGVDLEWMGWRPVGTLAAALAAVRAAGQPNGAILVDALHLIRNGAGPDDLVGLDPHLIRSVQICDAAATAPADRDGIIAEARGLRLPPGQGALPLGALLAALPEDAALSCEVPMAAPAAPADRAREIFLATRGLFGG
ncbi:MAG: TIM barrel protein [Rhodospirillales bacterium]|nr:TIM barrel protein [Rhodospirillales bacterium]